MLSPKAKRNLYRILPFGLIWLVAGWVFLAIEFTAVGDPDLFPETAIRMTFPIFVFASLATFLVGLLIGVLEVAYINKIFAKKSFIVKIVYKLLFYAVFMFFVILVTFPIAASLELETHIFNVSVWERYWEYLASTTFLSTYIQLTLSLLFSLFYAEISDNIGQGILINFFTGKYHQPVEEERIFMFLDMKSSTTIAEELGHVRYFQLLKAYYAAMSDAIVKHGGEIYQYVGDEIVLSWPFRLGVANSRCLHCFSDMKTALAKRGDWFQRTYGVVPTFKAGLHFGKVTTGEIGEIKKEILFTGDVLNATARIQGMCNAYGTDLLISAELASHLKPNDGQRFISMGENELRGRKGAIELFSLSQVELTSTKIN